MQEILTGKVFDYSRNGYPLVKHNGKNILIDGYKSAYKSTPDSVIDYFLDHSNPRFGWIIGDTPHKHLGTITGLSCTGDLVMDWCHKMILTKGYNVPYVGNVVKYRIIADSKKFYIAWVYDDPAFDTTIDGLITQSEKVDFKHSKDRESFKDILNIIHEEYNYGSFKDSFDDIRNLKETVFKMNVEKNYELINPLKFLEIIVKEESYSK